jgi:urease accessory protein UreH
MLLRLRRSQNKPVVIVHDQRREEARIRDVEMLLESLFLREEVTIRLIADCLYDVGSVNLVNQRFQHKLLNRCMKAIAHHSKPLFRLMMVRWSKKNCPHMIAEWLHSQVSFSAGQVVQPEVLGPEASIERTVE